MNNEPKQLPPELVEKIGNVVLGQFENGYDYLIKEEPELLNELAKIAVDYAEIELVKFCQSLMDYTNESHNTLGHDGRTAQDFVDVYLKKHEDG